MQLLLEFNAVGDEVRLLKHFERIPCVTCIIVGLEEHIGGVLDGVFSNVAERSEELLVNGQFNTQVLCFVAEFNR